jgi:putative restriction endonuclease
VSAVRGFVANTDYDWFAFLRERQPLDEVNFWQPTPGRALEVLQPGAPFFFRLKSPHRKIGGLGIFARREVVPAWLAWEAFGDKNGAPDREAMFDRVERLRPERPDDPRRRYPIGCLMVSEPVLFEDADLVEQPADFPVHPQGPGKSYDLTQGEGRRIWEDCQDRVRNRRSPIAAEAPARYGAAQLIHPRLGQGTFQVAVTQAYRGACAVSREHSLPVLDVAHIQPYAQGGPHQVSNGLLLRTDIHRLFDNGYVTVTPEYRFQVSQRLREEFDNGRTYYALEGQVIQLPDRPAERPDPSLLQWHNEEVFEKSRSA